MILKHDEAEPLELSSGPYGDVDIESLNGRCISQSAMAPAKDGSVGKLTNPARLFFPSPRRLPLFPIPRDFLRVRVHPVMPERRRRGGMVRNGC